MATSDADVTVEATIIEDSIPADILSGEENTAATESSKVTAEASTPLGQLPKRPATTAAKRTTAKVTATTKAPASSRQSTSNGLSKPPTRPLIATTARRIATSSTATTSSTTPKPRSSTLSDESSKPVSNLLSENRKPGTPATSKRASLASPMSKTADSKAAPAVSRRSTLGLVATEKKTTLSPRSTNPTSKPVAPSAPRSVRPAPVAAKSSTPATEAKRRLSTVPDSPATAKAAELAKSQERIAVLETDLTNLTEKLKAFSDEASKAEEEVGQRTESMREEHASKIDKLVAQHTQELELLRNELFAKQEQSQGKDALLSKQEMAHQDQADTLKKLQAQLSDMEATHSQHVRISAQHLEAAKSAASEENKNTETQFAEQRTAHERTMEKLYTELNAEKKQCVEKSAKLETVSTELTGLREQSKGQGEENKASMTALKNQHQAAEKARDEAISAKEEHISASRNELAALKASHAKDLDTVKEASSKESKTRGTEIKQSEQKMQEVEATNATLSQKCKSLETELAQHQKRLQELEGATGAADSKHKGSLAKKDGEIASLGQVITSLQEEIQKAHEKKDREVQSTKVTLAQQHEAALAALKQQHQEALRAAEQKVQDGVSDSGSEYARKVEDLLASHNEATAKHQAAYDALKKQAQSQSKSLESERDAAVQSRNELEKKHAEASTEVSSLRKVLETFDRDSQAKDKQYATAMKKVTDDLSKRIEAQNSEHKAALATLTSQKDELQQKSAKSVQGHEKALTDLQKQVVQHRKALADAEHNLQATRERDGAAQRDVKASHEAQVEVLKTDAAKSKADATNTLAELEAARGISTTSQSLAAAKDKDLQALQSQLAEQQKILNDEKSKLAQAVAAGKDHSELDQAKKEIQLLRESHAHEITELKNLMAAEHDKREKERKQGAEVRDKLARELSELETSRQQLLVAKEEIKKAQEEAKAVKDQLSESLKTAQTHETSAKEAANEAEKARLELAKVRTAAKRRSRSDSAFKNEIEALQLMADKERVVNEDLHRQLAEHTATSGIEAAQSKELEAKLKVSLAELTLVRAQLVNQKGAMAELGGSYVEVASKEVEGRDVASHIEGLMASMMEQVRQLEGVNEASIADCQRLVATLDHTHSAKPPTHKKLSPLAPAFEPANMAG